MRHSTKLKVNYCCISPSGEFHTFSNYRESLKIMDKDRTLEFLKWNLKHIEDNAIIFSFEVRIFKGELCFLHGGVVTLPFNYWTFVRAEYFSTPTPSSLLVLNRKFAAQLGAFRMFCTALSMRLVAGLNKGSFMSMNWYLFEFRSTARWAPLSAMQTERGAVSSSHVQVSAEFGFVQSFIFTPDMLSKCHLFRDIQCALALSCRLPKWFQKAKDPCQDQATSDSDRHESEIPWSKDPERPRLHVWALYSATCIQCLVGFFLSEFRTNFMLVFNLFLVYVTICMVVLEPGHCAQKNVFRGLVIRSRENNRIQADNPEGEFSTVLENSRVFHIK